MIDATPPLESPREHPPLTVEFMLDPAEGVRASRTIDRRRRFLWALATVGMMLALVLMNLAIGVRLDDLWLLWFSMLGYAFILLITPWSMRRQLKRQYAETPTLRLPQVYTFTDTGLNAAAGPASVALAWTGIIRAQETPEFFLLYYSKRCAYFVPKRAIRTPEDADALRALIQRHLGAVFTTTK